MYKSGEVLFFKQAGRSTRQKAPMGQFQGHGFGIFLGHVPPLSPEPPSVVLSQILSTIGLLTFDDVGEFLGADAAVECVAKCSGKYFPVDKAAGEASVPTPPSVTSSD